MHLRTPSIAVEGIGASGANGIAPDAGHEPDPDWQPIVTNRYSRPTWWFLSPP
jgi:hypothetical protein